MKDGLKLAEEKNNRPLIMDGYKAISTVYHHLDNNAEAYKYLMKHIDIKDSIQNKQFLLRIYNSKKDAEVEKKQAQLLLLDKDNKLKTGQLKQQAQQKNFLFILLSAFALAGFFVYRSIYLKRKNERLRLQNEINGAAA
jgi:lipopolysaccharide export LptBFGC system permease protein LptF